MYSNTKYIVVVDLDKKERIFTFHHSIFHIAMLEAVMRLREDRTRDHQFPGGKCVGAGFVVDGKCVGKSESIGVDSRGQADTALLLA